MTPLDFDSQKEILRKLLDISRQNWLFGAGISYFSNIPLMYPLTSRVEEIIRASGEIRDIEIYDALKIELDPKCHIEHYLSHLGDLIALAERSKTKSASLQKSEFSSIELLHIYKEIIKAIGLTVRYGYGKDKSGVLVVGDLNNPIVEIEHHINFIKAVFTNRANLISRTRITFFSTNYDTLLEDALGIERFNVIDGFSGGAIGYWNPGIEFNENSKVPNKCHLYKLHGSIDWHRDDQIGLVRVRYGTKYLSDMSDLMIYPQATKYIETQKDPFSYLFSGFRNALHANEDNVLITCGYSFGDEHINAEIEAALSYLNNRTTLIAFSEEQPDGAIVINGTLDRWINNPQFGSRVYVAGKKGIYYNSIIPIPPPSAKDLYWWTFSGLTKFISTGDHE